MPFNTATRGDGRTDNQGTDVLPITPTDNLNAESFTYDDLLAVKKVADTDTKFLLHQEEIGKLVLLTIFTDTTMAKELLAQLLKHQP